MRKKPQKIRLRTRFGSLVVVRRSHRDLATRRTFYVCRCDCGRETLAMAFKLFNGAKRSCGCLKAVFVLNPGRRRTYKSWEKMLDRCHNPRQKKFHLYGGRGITVCAEWRDSFAAFYAAMGDRPKARSLGRIDNEKGYEPGNCRWETALEQQDNRRVTQWTEFFGERETMRVACQRWGISSSVVYGRLKNGWSEDDAFLVPVRAKKPNRPKG